MPLSPITNIPVTWQNCLVDIHPTSQYGAAHDTALVSTVMQLQAPAGEDVEFILPTEEDPIDAPLLRLIEEDKVSDKVGFEPADLDGIDAELADALRAADDANRRIWQMVKEHSNGASKAKFKMKVGDQLVRFAYPARAEG